MHIVGIGVDSTTISRIEKSMANDSFLQRVFGDEERDLFARRKMRCATVAVNFAAKEALGKALGTGIDFPLSEVQLLRRENGAPYYSLTGGMAQRLPQNEYTLYVTATHEQDTATVFTMIVQEDKP